MGEVVLLDGGMGQELLSNGLISKGTLWSSTALLEQKYHVDENQYYDIIFGLKVKQ